MTDIVDRLRFDAARCEAALYKGVASNITAGADEIERLRREVARLEEAIATWRSHSYEVGVRLNQQNGEKT